MKRVRSSVAAALCAALISTGAFADPVSQTAQVGQILDNGSMVVMASSGTKVAVPVAVTLTSPFPTATASVDFGPFETEAYMPASNLEVFDLMKRMHEAVADIAMGHPRHQVAEAVTRVAAAIVAGCAPEGHEADALVIGATIFTERAGAVH